MPNWSYQDIYGKEGDEFFIRKCVSRKGDSHSGRTFDDKPVGMHFLTQGSVYILNADAEKTGEFGIGERIVQPNPLDYAKGHTILVSKELTEYYCICDPQYQTPWTGELVSVASGDTTTLKELSGKRVFVANGNGTFNGVPLSKNRVINCSSDEIEVTATNDLILAVFWKDQ